MIGYGEKVLAVAVAAALMAGPAFSASDAQRIQALEEQLAAQKVMMEQQQRSLDIMQQELQPLPPRLK